MHADFWNMIRKLYAVGILVYFGAAGVLALSISDFSGWMSFMGRHALYALACPLGAAAQINSWRRQSGTHQWLVMTAMMVTRSRPPNCAVHS